MVAISALLGATALWYFGIYAAKKAVTNQPTKEESPNLSTPRPSVQPATNVSPTMKSPAPYKSNEDFANYAQKLREQMLSTDSHSEAWEQTPSTDPDSEPIPDGSTFGISEVALKEVHDLDVDTHLVLKVSVKARPNTPIDHMKVKIQVFFYDMVDAKNIKLSDADISYEWLTPHHDWKDTNPEVLAVRYVRSKTKTTPAEQRKFLGYIVRVYYADQLQAVRAVPNKLFDLFPPPFTEQ